jgi:hypothetical protein
LSSLVSKLLETSDAQKPSIWVALCAALLALPFYFLSVNHRFRGFYKKSEIASLCRLEFIPQPFNLNDHD